MADPIRHTPGSLTTPALSGKLIIDTWRGKRRVRKWPRKRGPTDNPAILEQVNWFTWATRFWNYVAPDEKERFQEQTKGTPLTGRDYWMLALQAKLWDIHLTDGRVLQGRRPAVPVIDLPMFLFHLQAPLALPSGVFIAPNWPPPVIDNFGFWNPATPALITIPDGIDTMIFAAGMNVNNTAAGTRAILLNEVAVVTEAMFNIGGVFLSGATCGPVAVPVTQGQQYEVQYLTTPAQTLLASNITYWFGAGIKTTS